MQELIIIGAGGFIGAILRYTISGWVQASLKEVDMPYGTLAVNIIGSFAIGFLMQLSETRGFFGPTFRSFVFIGLLGALTTFSTFSLETINLTMAGEGWRALANVGANVVLCLGAVLVARSLVIGIWR